MHRSKLFCQLPFNTSSTAITRTRLSNLQNNGSRRAVQSATNNNRSILQCALYSVSLSTKQIPTTYPNVASSSAYISISSIVRSFSSSAKNCDTKVSPTIEHEKGTGSQDGEGQEDKKRGEGLIKNTDSSEPPNSELSFLRSEKAIQASQLNLSARLPKDKKSPSAWAGFKELWRLIMIARREVKTLGIAFCFILVGSSIGLSIPYSIGKILDLATKPSGGVEHVFGIDLTTFYLVLGGLISVQAAATFGRIVTLRIVGERIVARLRSQLFRRTYAQNAEFFDANRTGDLISRLSSDTLIVGKSITHNLSEGLRSVISGSAGIGAMTYVSPELTLLMAALGPPVALGLWFYGRIVRDIGRKVQDNLGTLTKIAEERLGNVKTSQSFAGEILEVARYNKQTKKIFDLGLKDALYSATYYGGVSRLIRSKVRC